MRRAMTPLLVCSFLLVMVSPALAQDKVTTTTSSWFRMFLWSDDFLGLLCIWLLVLMSAVSMGWSLTLVLRYRKSMVVPDETHQQIETMLAEKRYREAIEYSSSEPSYLAKVVSSGLSEASNGYGAMERAVEESSDAETTRMLRPIEYLNVMGNIAPMLGLFGTVYGMIMAFNKLVETGGKPDPGELAAGISTALVTTFWGLVVAIPTLSAYALIRNHLDALTAEGLVLAEELIRPFKPAAANKRPPAAPGGTRPRVRPNPNE